MLVEVGLRNEANFGRGLLGIDRTLEIQKTCGSFTLRPGERLRIGPAVAGFRAYLAVAEGWTSPAPSERRLEIGERVEARASQIPQRWLTDSLAESSW